MPRRFQLALLAAELVAVATLIRSVAYDRWATVLAAVLLIVGTMAARRGRTWGVGLAFASACAFPVAWLIGIAPMWFAFVGLVGALPFAMTSRAFARFDKGATAMLASLAITAGALGAIGWKEIAYPVFRAVPMLRPSIEAQHGLALTLGLIVLGAIVGRSWRREAQNEAQIRVAAEHYEGVRIFSDTSTHADDEVRPRTEDDEQEQKLRRQAR